MRLLIDTMIAMMLAGVLVGLVLHDRNQRQMLDRYQAVHDAMGELQEQNVYHCATGRTPLTEAGFPLEISPTWFSHQGLPRNIMLPGRHPWLDIAPDGDFNAHPPDLVALGPDQPGFWYNPNIGVIRARVPWNYDVQVALKMYNRLNSADLVKLPRNDPLRQPRLAATSPPKTSTFGR